MLSWYPMAPHIDVVKLADLQLLSNNGYKYFLLAIDIFSMTVTHLFKMSIDEIPDHTTWCKI